MNRDLPCDPGLPPGVTDDMTEERSMTPMTVKVCPACDGKGTWLIDSPHGVPTARVTCQTCNGTGFAE